MSWVDYSDAVIGFSLKRATPRFISARQVTAVLLAHGVACAHGAVKNLSEGGLCLLADPNATKIKGLRVEMNFHETVVEADVRVAWSEGHDRTQGDVSAVLHGIEFLSPSEESMETVRRVLRSSDFVLSGELES